MKEIEAQSVEDLKMLIVVGEKQRTVASTVMNTNRYSSAYVCIMLCVYVLSLLCYVYVYMSLYCTYGFVIFMCAVHVFS